MYESPRIHEVGNAVDLTLGYGIAGSDDYGVFIVGRSGKEIPVSYGVS